MIYFQLFYEFFMTGLFAVGGGLATLPFLYDISDRTGWFTHGHLADMIAISESTPGAIGVNMATYAGYTTAGIPGAIIATLGLITPSLIIIIIIARILKTFKNNPNVQAVFSGLRPASTALIAAAGFSVLVMDLIRIELYEETGLILDLLNWQAFLLAVVIFFLTNRVKATKKLHPVVFIAFAAVIGILFNFSGA
ncbi:chromate transporter [Natronobacillus azotifigens]|uniref:Chromate transporter n=1 Tax=Natronobacillus azotifigens TaxID=472978 RepID=A0A9J6R9G5_9BACI|nr:chromate transporter [Natronobacillus azotifigens]MCZ0701947.1 chromate transporter [Natronobacillus azotifigens]